MAFTKRQWEEWKRKNPEKWEERRKKLSRAHKDKTLSDIHRKKIAKSMKGRTKTEEHKQKIREALKRKFRNGPVEREIIRIPKFYKSFKFKISDKAILVSLTLVTLALLLLSNQYFYSGLVLYQKIEWENYTSITLDKSMENASLHIIFGNYKSTDCKEEVFATDGENNISFDVVNPVYQDGLCSEADIVFANPIYKPCSTSCGVSTCGECYSQQFENTTIWQQNCVANYCGELTDYECESKSVVQTCDPNVKCENYKAVINGTTGAFWLECVNETSLNQTEIISGSALYGQKTTKTYYVYYGKKPKVEFDRDPQCDKCGKHKVPPETDVNMTISATTDYLIQNATFSDYYPNSWNINNPNGGKITVYNDTYNKIEWFIGNVNGKVERWYVIHSPQRQLPPEKYYFQSELNEAKSDWWQIIVADPAIGATDDRVSAPCSTTKEYPGAAQSCTPSTNMTAETPVNVTFNIYGDNPARYANGWLTVLVKYGNNTTTLNNANKNLTDGSCTGSNNFSISNGYCLNATTGWTCSWSSTTKNFNFSSSGNNYPDFNVSYEIAPCPGSKTVGWEWDVSQQLNQSSGSWGTITIPRDWIEAWGITDIAPLWQNQGTNDSDNVIDPGQAINLSAQGKDDAGLEYAILETNETGVYENKTGFYGSPMDMGSATSWTWSNFTWKNTSIEGKNITWRIWYNDTTNKYNKTDYLTFKINGYPPKWWSPTINDTSPINPAQAIEHRVNWTDETSLSYYYFEWNATLSGSSCTGGFSNATNGAVTGTQNWTNVTRTLPYQCNNTVISWRVFANDSMNQWNKTNYYNYTIKPYGWLNVTLTSPNSTYQNPSNPLEVIQNATYFQNATVFCNGPSNATCGNVSIEARYNNTTTSANYPISNLYGSQPLFIINGLNDTSELQFYKPLDYETSIASPYNAYDKDYNDSTTYVNLTLGTANYSFSLPDVVDTARLFVTTRGSKTVSNFIRIYNYTSDSWYGWLTVTWLNTQTNSTIINRSSGLIGPNGNVLINATGSNSATDYFFDTYISLLGNEYNYVGIYNPSSMNNATIFTPTDLWKTCSAGYGPWCSGSATEFSSTQYGYVQYFDSSYMSTAVPTTPLYENSQLYHLRINETDVSSLIVRYQGYYYDQSPAYLYIWNVTANDWSLIYEIPVCSMGPTCPSWPDEPIFQLELYNASQYIKIEGNGNRYVHFKVGIPTSGYSGDYVYTDYIAVMTDVSNRKLCQLKNTGSTVSSCSVSWLVNATGAVNSLWAVDVNTSSLSYNSSMIVGNNSTDGYVKIISGNNAPQWSQNATSIASNSQYSPANNYGFEINWTDPDGGMAAVSQGFFLTNLTGSNISYNKSSTPVVTNNTAGTYWINFTNIGVGTYFYQWKANDTSNAWNSSDTWIYVIAKNTTSVMRLWLNDTENNKSYVQGETANFTAYLNASGKTIYLTSNYTGWADQSSSTSRIENFTTLNTLGDWWNLTAYWNGDANYTSSSKTYFFNVTSNCQPPVTGDWNITQNDNIICIDKTIYLDGNLTVYGNLTFLRNVTFRLNLTNNGTANITVYSGGNFSIWNQSNISSNNTNYGYGFEVKEGSKFQLNSSEVHYAGWQDYVGSGSDISFNASGLYINTTDALVYNNTLSFNAHGIVIGKAINVTSNRIFNNSYDGVLFPQSGIGTPNISSNLIQNHSGFAGIYIGYKSVSPSTISNCYVIVMSNNISYDKYGINLYGCGNVTASNNRIYNSTDYGIYGYTENNSVSNNDIKNVTNTGEFAIGSGIYSGAGLGGSGYNNITNNNISNTYYGIYLTGILNNISNNRINSTTLGIYNPTGTYNNTIKNNTISYSSQYGIMLNNSDYNNIQNNTLTSNGDGLLFYNSTNNDITDDNNISFNSRLGVVFIDSYPNINMTQVENNTDGKGIFSWSVFAEVRNTTGFGVENAYLDAKNVSAIISSFNYSEYYTPINSFTTDSLGDTSRFIVYENKTLNDSTTTKYNNHTFFANKTAIGSGKNISNVTERMKIIIVITPHAPVVSNVFVDDDTLPLNNISLYGATTRNVKCNATIVDEDGWWDVNVSNITFFDTGYQWYSPDDNNTHYSNSSCNLFGWSGIDTSLYAECIAPIWYYANSTFWNCNMTVNDTFNNVSWANDTNYIDGLLAIGLNNTTEFGVVNAGQISSNDVNNTVTNYGNIRIDLQLNGSQMPCTYGGSLPVGLEKYNCTNYNQNYDTRMDNLTTSLNGANCTGFDLTKQKDLAESMKNVSWKIQIPATGFGGVCTGTIWYTAMSG